MSWGDGDVFLTCLSYQTHEGATILSGVAFTRGPRLAELTLALRRNGCFGSQPVLSASNQPNTLLGTPAGWAGSNQQRVTVTSGGNVSGLFGRLLGSRGFKTPFVWLISGFVIVSSSASNRRQRIPRYRRRFSPVYLPEWHRCGGKAVICFPLPPPCTWRVSWSERRLSLPPCA